MRISVIVCTYNRAHSIFLCLNSIVEAIKYAKTDAEIVIVDNGSTDGTAEFLKQWNTTVPVQIITENKRGKGFALNAALRVAKGKLIVFIDDDCRMQKDHLVDALKHDADDQELVLRGGIIELGDPTDLPLTINTIQERNSWSLAQNSARHHHIAGKINGCNMVMKREVIDKIGFFDERFGPGSRYGSGDDTEYMYRAYLAEIKLEHVPDMVVYHFHGRKTLEVGQRLWKNYLLGAGAINAKYLLRHPNLCRSMWWDIKNMIVDGIKWRNTFVPEVKMSHVHKVFYNFIGMVNYFIYR